MRWRGWDHRHVAQAVASVRRSFQWRPPLQPRVARVGQGDIARNDLHHWANWAGRVWKLHDRSWSDQVEPSGPQIAHHRPEESELFVKLNSGLFPSVGEDGDDGNGEATRWRRERQRYDRSIRRTLSNRAWNRDLGRPQVGRSRGLRRYNARSSLPRRPGWSRGKGVGLCPRDASWPRSVAPPGWSRPKGSETLRDRNGEDGEGSRARP